MTAKTDMIATRVEGIRPPVPAANSTDANTNALHTDIAAAEDMIDTHAAPPPAKAADPDGFDYFACKKFGHLYRFAPGSNVGDVNSGGRRWITALILRNEMEPPHKEVHEHGPATEDECRAWLGWPKANPDDHGDNGQSERTRAATVERVGTIPTCAACGSPKPTDATGADIVREYLRLSIVWNEKGAGLIGPAGDEAWYVARNRAAYDVTQFLGANLATLKASTGGVA